MNLANPGVTLGCVVVGTIIVVMRLLYWWKKGGRDVKALLPFVFALCYGMLAVLSNTSWSVLGFLTRAGLWGGNGLGYAYLVWGIGGDSPSMNRAVPIVLTTGGMAVLAIWTAVIIGVTLWSKRQTRLDNTLGCVAGVLLGLSEGIAGVAVVPLASGVNMFGAWYHGSVS